MSEWKELDGAWKDDPTIARGTLKIGESVRLVLKYDEGHWEDPVALSTDILPLEYSQEWPTLGQQWLSMMRTGELGTRTPANLEDRLERLEGAVLELSEALLSRPVVTSTAIVDLNSSSYSLRHPIPVVVEEYRDEAVATFLEVEARGWGTTPAEAVNDLKDQVILLYEELTEADPEELGKLPTAWSRVLRDYVAKSEKIS